MFDTMTVTKVVGGLCGTLLVFLLGGWMAELVYFGPDTHPEEGAELHQSYVIPVEAAAAGGEELTPEEIAAQFEEAFAAADPAAGEAEFRPCSACHSVVAGENKVGPSLHGVVGRAVDAVPDFDYSGALLQVGEVWDPATLSHFIENPKAAAPGTKMNFNGIRDLQDRANLIAWLATQSG